MDARRGHDQGRLNDKSTSGMTGVNPVSSTNTLSRFRLWSKRYIRLEPTMLRLRVLEPTTMLSEHFREELLGQMARATAQCRTSATVKPPPCSTSLDFRSRPQ